MMTFIPDISSLQAKNHMWESSCVVSASDMPLTKQRFWKWLWWTGMLVGGGQSISSSTPDFALQFHPACLLPVSSPGYIDLHNGLRPHSLSAYESTNQTQKVFLWLLWAVSKATKSFPVPCIPLSSLGPTRPFGIPVFSTFRKALEVSAVK